METGASYGKRHPKMIQLLLTRVQRSFADKPVSSKGDILSSDPAFKPASTPPSGPVKTEVPLGPGGPGSPAPKNTTPTPATPSSSSPVPPQSLSTASTTPIKVQTSPPTSTATVSPPLPAPKPVQPAPSISATPPPAAPPPKPRRFRTLRALFYLTLVNVLGYGGAVFFALQNDNFHDFFTEYVPFGEESVLYFEERAFHKRFPNARQHSHRASPAANADPKVTIPSRSGLSWRVAEDHREGGSDLTQKGKHMSAVDATVPAKSDVRNAQQAPGQASGKEKTKAVEAAKKSASSEVVKPGEATRVPKTDSQSKADAIAKPEPDVKPAPMPQTSTPSPKQDPRPPAIAPITQLSTLEIANAEEPLVQELAKIVNDLITVINADSADASNRYYAPITKAKDSLAEVGNKILALKAVEREAAEHRVKEAHKEFDEGAKQLLQRIEAAQREDDARYREEFEAEREKMSQSYDARLKSEVQRSQEVAAQRLQNELTEQAIEMKRQFITDIKSLVESERDGRLAKLSDLSSNVENLSELTSNWNGVIDSNLTTQNLQVAIDAIRAALNSSTALDSPNVNNPSTGPKPFVRELAALKLVADSDPIIDAAISSINPRAYQRGIPSQPQLIDRFRRVASEVRKASLLPENAGVASHAASFLLSKVMFKKAGQPLGGDVESVLTRSETMLEEGNLDGAAREMNQLNGWAGVLAQDWLGDVRKVLEVRQAVEVCEAEVRLRALQLS